MTDSTVGRLVINSLLGDRAALAGRMGVTFGGDRDIFLSAGYKEVLQFSDYLSAYRRGDIAHRVVVAAPDETWRLMPSVSDGIKETTTGMEGAEGTATEFETAWAQLAGGGDVGDTADTSPNVWHYMALVDRLSGVGRYGVLYLGVNDGVDPAQPLNAGSLRQARDLLYMQAFDEGGAQIAQVETDRTSRRYGLPLLYRLSVSSANGGVGEVQAHWTRCLHVAENTESNPLLGAPRLEVCWNRLIDLLKVLAGSGEAAWKLLDAGHILTTREGKRLPTDSDKLNELEDQIDEFVHGLRRWLLAEGLEATQVGGSIGDPTGLIMANVSLISAATGIPQRILLGSERGELASTQDADNWAAQIETRQRLHAEPNIIRAFIQRMVWAGVLPRPSSGIITVRWQSLRRENKAVAAGVAVTVADALQKAGITIDPTEFVKAYLPDIPASAVAAQPPPPPQPAQFAQPAQLTQIDAPPADGSEEVTPNSGVPFRSWRVASDTGVSGLVYP